MKNIFRILLFCTVIAGLICLGCYGCKGQVPASPTYVGALDGNVYIPAFFKGKSYKIAGNRIGGGGTVIIGDTVSGQPATVGINGGAPGTVNVAIAKNGYGMVSYINTTGSLYGGVEITVTYSHLMATTPVPVICNYKSSGSYLAPFLLISATTSGFIVRFTDSIPNGGNTSFNYIVKGF